MSLLRRQARPRATPLGKGRFDRRTVFTIAVGSGLNAGASDTIAVKTKLDATATNPDQGLQATQGFTFTIDQ